MKQKKRKTSLLQKLTALALCMALMLTCLPVYAAAIQSEPVPAASASSTKAYKNAYKKLLLKKEFSVSAKNGPMSFYSTLKVKPASFLLLDIDRNGTPELIISNSAPTANYSTRYVFTMKNSKAVFCGYYYQNGNPYVEYSKKHKALWEWWWTNGLGGSGEQLLRISNYKLNGYHSIWAGCESITSSRQVYKYAKGNAEMKLVSKAKYNSIAKKYFSDKKKSYEFVENTAANRNKLLK